MADGKHVISNRKGDNLLAGVTTTMLTNADLRGEIKADAAVLEVDELNIPYIIKGLPVSALVVTNFFVISWIGQKKWSSLFHVLKTVSAISREWLIFKR